MRIASGTIDQPIYFVAVDATDKSTRLTALSSFTVRRTRNGGASALYTTPTIVEISAVGMPGLYSLLLDEDTTVDAGNKTEEYVVHITHAGMHPVTRVIELYDPDAIVLTEEQVEAIAEIILEAIESTGVEANVRSSGGVLLAQISDSSLHPKKYLEIIQGEEKVITFIVEATNGLFTQEIPDIVSCKIADPEGNVVEKIYLTDSDSDAENPIELVTSQIDIQVFRVTLTAEDTLELQSGLARIELTLDTQKARLAHAVKVIEAIPSP